MNLVNEFIENIFTYSFLLKQQLVLMPLRPASAQWRIPDATFMLIETGIDSFITDLFLCAL